MNVSLTCSNCGHKFEYNFTLQLIPINEIAKFTGTVLKSWRVTSRCPKCKHRQAHVIGER
jgi:hypothetical protein